MIIELSDNWRIVTGNLNFELQERTVIKNGDNAGQYRWTFRGYYSGLQSVLRAIPDHLALSPSVTTYQEFLESWEDLRNQIGGRFKR